MMEVFISYSRKDQERVLPLISDLKDIGNSVWYDQELSGGEAWWSGVLSRIRACDLFVIALSNDSIHSEACMREFEYAQNLNRSILPVIVSDVSAGSLPSILSAIQHIEYKERDHKAALALSRAMMNLPAAVPLPDPLPSPPEIPISYVADELRKLRRTVEGLDALPGNQQFETAARLKTLLRESEVSNQAKDLLIKLRRRLDTLAHVADEIDAALSDRGGSGSPRGAVERQQLEKESPPKDNGADRREWHAELLSKTKEECALRITLSEENHTVKWCFDETTSATREVITVDGRIVFRKIMWVDVKGSYSFNVSDGKEERRVDIRIKSSGLVNKFLAEFELVVDGRSLFSG